MIAIWTAFIVLGLVLCIGVVVPIVRLASRARLLTTITIDTYNVYISNNNKCRLWQYTDKALKRNNRALKRAINDKKRSGEEIRLVIYNFITPAPEFMSAPGFYYHVKSRCDSIADWHFAGKHNIELRCEYYHTKGNNI